MSKSLPDVPVTDSKFQYESQHVVPSLDTALQKKCESPMPDLYTVTLGPIHALRTIGTKISSQLQIPLLRSPQSDSTVLENFRSTPSNFATWCKSFINALSLNISQPTADTIKGQPHINLTQQKWFISYMLFAIWICSFLVIGAICLSFSHLHVDSKSCNMSYMSPSFTQLQEFNNSHLASKYSLYLYRERQIDTPFDSSGIPVIFIPGNAGSFRQVRALAAASAVTHHSEAIATPRRNPKDVADINQPKFDYFTVDFHDDLTAFNGHSLYDQAKYLNEAVRFIIGLYSRSENCQSKDRPLPTSVILIGHSMGGVVARAMLTMDNYKKGSVNTIFTLSAPHTLPPFSSNKEIVAIYDRVNKYWERSFSQDFIGRNPLANVAVVSIAGGGLDSMISSESTSLSSTTPPSNGITVFTNSIPFVWSGVDHQAIVWCDQFRSIFAAAMADMVDLRIPSKTKVLSERMAIFRKYFLGGFDMGLSPNYLETRFQPSVGGAEKVRNESFIPPKVKSPDTILWLEDITTSTTPVAQKLVVNNLGVEKLSTYLMPVPQIKTPRNSVFSLLTNSELLKPSTPSENFEEIIVPSFRPFKQLGKMRSGLYLLACRYPYSETIPQSNFVDSAETKKEDGSRLGLLCKNLALEVSTIPQALTAKQFPQLGTHDYASFLQYDVSQLEDYDMIALVDAHDTATPGFAIAEFSSKPATTVNVKNPIKDFFTGVSVNLLSPRPMMVDISYNSIWSSLLAFRARVLVKEQQDDQIFKSFIRQYAGDSYESKYHLNVQNESVLNITIFGVAPFSPFGIREFDDDFEGNLFYYGQENCFYHNLHLQVWSDGTQDIQVVLTLDVSASLGKLFLHYRTAIAVFPLAVVILVLMIQFRIYTFSGIFIDFIQGLGIFISSLLVPIMCGSAIFPYFLHWSVIKDMLYLIEPDMDYMSGDGPSSIFTNIRRNQFFLGLEPGHFWFLGPCFIFISVGFCYFAFHLLNFIIYVLDMISLSVSLVFTQRLVQSTGGEKKAENDGTGKGFYLKMPWKFAIVFLFLFAVLILLPYEAAYIVTCLLQVRTTLNAKLALRNNLSSISHIGFLNMTVSILILMFWLTPITLPMFIVWVRALTDYRWTLYNQFSVLAVSPVLFFTQVMGSGKSIPRPRGKFQYMVTELLLVYIAIYTLIFGVQRAYMLYHLCSVFFGWLVLLHVINGNDHFDKRGIKKKVDKVSQVLSSAPTTPKKAAGLSELSAPVPPIIQLPENSS